MKKIVFFITFIALLAAGALSANPKIFKPHKGLKGKDEASLNCAYCHSKAAIPKTSGQDLNAAKKGQYCAMNGCH